MQTHSIFKLPTTASRFWSLAGRRSVTDCWHWTGPLFPLGYGDFGRPRREARERLAHREAWRLHHGEIPAGLLVRHCCANTDCVNPTHLRLGNDSQNKRDRILIGRNSFKPAPRKCPRVPTIREESVCAYCGLLFYRNSYYPPIYCCKQHAVLGRQRPAADRFWAMVEKTPTCWLWKGAKGDKGHGTFGFNGKQTSAHRVAWELLRGSIPEGLWVLHNCPEGDNPACVNPDHLWLGTVADNNRDMFAKGRGAVGDRHPARCRGDYLKRGDQHPFRLRPELVRRGADSNLSQNPPRGEAKGTSKLNNAAVREIRRRVNAGESRRQVAFAFHVCPNTVGNIMLGRIWTHVD